MCIRDRRHTLRADRRPRARHSLRGTRRGRPRRPGRLRLHACLLYTSDAADDLLRVDLGGRRIIQKNTPEVTCSNTHSMQITPTGIRTRHRHP